MCHCDVALNSYGIAVPLCCSFNFPSLFLLWCCIAMVLQCYGAAVLLCCSSIVLQCYGAVVLWCCSAIVLQCYGAAVL